VNVKNWGVAKKSKSEQTQRTLTRTGKRADGPDRTDGRCLYLHQSQAIIQYTARWGGSRARGSGARESSGWWWPKPSCGLFTLVVMLHLCLSALARIFTGIWLSGWQISEVWYNRQSHSEREDDCSGGRGASGCAGIRVGPPIVGGPRNDHVSIIVGPCRGQVHGETAGKT
jgi:hypothetical protein